MNHTYVTFIDWIIIYLVCKLIINVKLLYINSGMMVRFSLLPLMVKGIQRAWKLRYENCLIL